MAKFLSLLKVQFLAFFGLNKALKSKGAKKVGKLSGLFGALILYTVLFGFIGFIYSGIFAESLILTQGSADALLPIMLAISALISFFFSFYTTTGALYGFKDYELLTSLPIKTTLIIWAKLAFMFISDLFFAVVIMIPSTIVYSQYAVLEVTKIVSVFVMTIFSPLLPMALSVLVGGLVAFISTLFKKKALVQIIMWVIILALIFAAGFFTGMEDEEMFDPTLLISKAYFILPLAVAALKDVVQLLLFVAVNALPFVVVSLVVAATYKKMNGLLTRKRTVKNFVLKESKIQNKSGTLLRKELKCFFSNATYVVNCLFGAFFGIIGAVVMAVVVVVMTNDTGVNAADMLTPFVPLILSFCYMLSPSTACTISLEGNVFWVTRTSPVSTMDILNAKLKVGIITGALPALISAVLYGVIVGLNIIHLVALSAFAFAVGLLGSVLGLLMNLLFPMMKWDNESVPVKQGASVLLTILCGMGYTGLMLLGVLFIPLPSIAVLLISLLLTVLLVTVFYSIIYKKCNRLIAKKIG